MLRNKRLSLLIWGVVRHKDVDRKMAQIGKSLDDLNRDFVTYHDLGFSGTMLDGDAILLDPVTSTPTKAYQLPTSELGRLAERLYTPHLKMTASESKIVETNGTVCILGRSGTGKTVGASLRLSLGALLRANCSVSNGCACPFLSAPLISLTAPRVPPSPACC